MVQFAQIHQGVRQPCFFQQGGDAVGDVTLGDAVEGDAHFGSGEADFAAAELNVLEADVLHGLGKMGRRGLAVGVAAEPIGIEMPQGLHGGVKRTLGEPVPIAALA